MQTGGLAVALEHFQAGTVATGAAAAAFLNALLVSGPYLSFAIWSFDPMALFYIRCGGLFIVDVVAGAVYARFAWAVVVRDAHTTLYHNKIKHGQ